MYRLKLPEKNPIAERHGYAEILLLLLISRLPQKRRYTIELTGFEEK